MRVLLFYPPQCRPLHAHLALPMLKAELQRRGHTCLIVDLNIKFYNHVLSRQTMEQTAHKIEAELERMYDLDCLDSASSVRYYRMSSALIRSKYLVRYVDDAVSVLRSDECFQYGRFLWARKVIEEALDLYGAAFGYTDIGISQLRMRYSTASASDVLAATRDTEENPFIETVCRWAEEEVERFVPDVIGITFALDEQLIPGFTLACHLRSRWTGMLVAGGSMITRLRDKLPTQPQLARVFDKYFPFESEKQFGAFVDGLEGKNNSEDVPFYDTLPDFDDLDLDSYLLPVRVLPFQGSRGCSYGKCLYCSHYKTYDRYVFGKPISAARQLKTLSEKYNCRHFHFVDEGLEPRFGMELGDELEKIGADIRWMVFARLHRGWNEEVVKKIARAGCRRLIFGLDGATERIQELMDKHTDIDHAERVLQWCSNEGIAAQLNFIVGYPGEEEWEARESIAFVRKNRDALMTVGVSIAMSSFALVEEAAWTRMGVTPLVRPEKPLAIYYAYSTKCGLTMKETGPLGQALQTEADRVLGSSARFPLLRELAFLYKDHYDSAEPIRRDLAPSSSPETAWFNRDLFELYTQIATAKKELENAPQEYLSVWWRLATESDLVSKVDGALHGYRLQTQYDESTFELAIANAFRLAPTGPSYALEPA
jgi:anaerobic magnesium-protoporphyrin IX monomethyl ester cyclase